MRRSRFIPQLLTLALAAGARDAAPGPPAAVPAPDEQVIAKLVDELESDDPAVRTAASERLRKVGPEVIPVLQQYVGSVSPEVAGRVRAAIASYKWMSRGAILINVDGGEPGALAGLLAGDVIVKIDDADVDLHTDFLKARAGDRPSTLYVWREGTVRAIRVPAGKLGIRMSNWDAARGGSDHSRGVAAFSGKPPAQQPDLDEAYRRLHAARAAGMADPQSLSFLAALAARQLKADEAAEAYAAYRKGVAPGLCELSHGLTDIRFNPVPFNSPHTQWLLARYRDEPFSVALYHELEDWFAQNGRNAPMAAEIVAKPWPERTTHRLHAFYHDQARMLLWLTERRFDDVLNVWDARLRPEGWEPPKDLAPLALQAAVRSGNVPAATALGIDRLRHARLPSKFNGGRPLRSDEAFWSFVLAAADGDDRAAEEFLAVLGEADASGLEDALQGRSADALFATPAARTFRDWYWAPGRPRPAKPGRAEAIALSGLVADPAATAEQFAAHTDKLDPAALRFDHGPIVVTGLLRFGQYDRARAMAAALEERMRVLMRATNARARAAADFAAKHAGRLAGPWADLKGFVQVAPGRDAGTTWVLRYDGAVFLADEKADAPRRPAGLPAAPPSGVTTSFPHLRVSTAGVAVVYPYGRLRPESADDELPPVVYVLNAAGDRFVPLAETDGPIDLSAGLLEQHDTQAALAARAVGRNHPALPGGAPREYRASPPYFRFEGDVLVHVDPVTRDVTDLSSEIARLAGRDKPARVWRDESAPAAADETLALIYSDCGAWWFEPGAADKAKRLSRVTLGLADENVIASPLPANLYGPRRDGVALVGIAPQHGGQVFLVDRGTRQVTATRGYCGLGPPDWFDARRDWWRYHDPQPYTYLRYLKRLTDAKRS